MAFRHCVVVGRPSAFDLWDVFMENLDAGTQVPPTTSARRKCQLARIMHKHLPVRGAEMHSQRALSALSRAAARIGELAARSRHVHGNSFGNLTCAGIVRKEPPQQIDLAAVAFFNRRRPQVGCTEMLTANELIRTARARCTSIMHTMVIHSGNWNFGCQRDADAVGVAASGAFFYFPSSPFSPPERLS